MTHVTETSKNIQLRRKLAENGTQKLVKMEIYSKSLKMILNPRFFVQFFGSELKHFASNVSSKFEAKIIIR